VRLAPRGARGCGEAAHLGRGVFGRAVQPADGAVLVARLGEHRAVHVGEQHLPRRALRRLPHLHHLRLDVAQHDARVVRALHDERQPREYLLHVGLAQPAALLDQREQVGAHRPARRRELAKQQRAVRAAHHLVQPQKPRRSELLGLGRRVVQSSLRPYRAAKLVALSSGELRVHEGEHRIVHARLRVHRLLPARQHTAQRAFHRVQLRQRRVRREERVSQRWVHDAESVSVATV